MKGLLLFPEQTHQVESRKRHESNSVGRSSGRPPKAPVVILGGTLFDHSMTLLRISYESSESNIVIMTINNGKLVI